jgi:hypothetical protein
MTAHRIARLASRLVSTAAAATLIAYFSFDASAQHSQLIKVVTNGQPWTMTQADGTKGQVTLTPDGKGQMQIGSRVVSPTWRQNEAGQLCLKPALIIPERCATLRREGQTILGLDNGAVQFRLDRS